MGRHEQREQIFRLLFRVEFHPAEALEEQVRLFFEDEELLQIPGKDVTYITEKFNRITGRLTELDKMLDERTEGWNTSRMGRVELALLRLALYEILFDDEVPAGVAINEAVELAKTYGQDNSGGFVNAVLAKFVR